MQGYYRNKERKVFIMAESRLIGKYPVIGIRPTIDGRRGYLKVRESLEEQTMNMAISAKKLFEENLRYTNGEPVKVVISPTTIGRVAEAARCADYQGRMGIQWHRASRRRISGKRSGYSCTEGTSCIRYLRTWCTRSRRYRNSWGCTGKAPSFRTCCSGGGNHERKILSADRFYLYGYRRLHHWPCFYWRVPWYACGVRGWGGNYPPYERGYLWRGWIWKGLRMDQGKVP